MTTVQSRPMTEARCSLCGWSEVAPRPAPEECPQCHGICPTCFAGGVDVMQEDVRSLLNVLGLGDHARPISCHEVIRREILPAIRGLQGLYEAADWLVAQVEELWITTCVGNPAPATKALHDRMQAPKVGDHVVISHAMGSALDRVGQLTLVEDVRADAEWEDGERWNEQAEGRPCPTFKRWTIATLDGRLVRWENCLVLRMAKRGERYERLESAGDGLGTE